MTYQPENPPKSRRLDWLLIVVVAILAIAAFAIARQEPNTVLQGGLGAFSIVAVLFLAGLATLVVLKMADNSIDLKYLIADQDGDASLSRFQMLLFTFVVAGLYFIYALYSLFSVKSGSACPGDLASRLGDVAKAVNDVLAAANAAQANDTVKAATNAKATVDGLAAACRAFELPGIPSTVLGLIGISGGSYLVSKGIQAAATQGSGNGTSADQPSPPPVRRNVN